MNKQSAQGGHYEKHRLFELGVETIKMFGTKFCFTSISDLLNEVRSYCLTTECDRISLNVNQDANHDKELVGHVFHNSVTSNPRQCFLWCINDCRCLSINDKVKNDTIYCELNEGSHFTNKNSLKNIHGSVYYVLRREYSTEVPNFTM